MLTRVGPDLCETAYTYDVDMVWDPGDPDQYPTHNNRLLYYELVDTSQTPDKKLRTVSYTYYDAGDASNITIKDEDPTGGNDPAYDWHNDLALYYEGGRQTLRLALWDRWKLNQYGNPTDYERLHGREFRYEWAVADPRERYLAVDYDPSASNDPNSWTLIEPVRLTDYLGETPYADADVTNDGGWSVAGTLRYLFPGAQETVGTAETQYYHGDLIGSTMLTTDDQGAPSLPGVGDGFVAYTAFGETLDASGSPGGDPPEGFPRYQYAGAWGYETAGFGDDDPGGPTGSSHLLALYGVNPNLPAITLQHVGFRWYDPALGRFIQRDPIGILGGLNVYAYVRYSPLRFIDPRGTRLEGDVVPGPGGKIYVHWYDIPPKWKFWKDPEYKGKQVFRRDPLDKDGNNLSDDTAKYISDRQNQYVLCLTTLTAELDKELRKATKRWLGKTGTIGKVGGPIIVD